MVSGGALTSVSVVPSTRVPGGSRRGKSGGGGTRVGRRCPGPFGYQYLGGVDSMTPSTGLTSRREGREPIRGTGLSVILGCQRRLD